MKTLVYNNKLELILILEIENQTIKFQKVLCTILSEKQSNQEKTYKIMLKYYQKASLEVKKFYK